MSTWMRLPSVSTCFVVRDQRFGVRGEDFDSVDINEAAVGIGSTEMGVSCWIPILRGKKVPAERPMRCALILAGDHCQLAPTIMSKEAEKSGTDAPLYFLVERVCV
eukprot:918358-Rhodomonas_salina.5